MIPLSLGRQPSALSIRPSLRPGGRLLKNKTYALTDGGNAEAFADTYRDQLRWDRRRGCWFRWDKSRWVEEDASCLDQYAIALARKRRDAAEQMTGETREKTTKWAFRSENLNHIRATSNLAKGHDSIGISGDEWNADPWLLGVRNGVVNLKTGELLPAQPCQNITAQAVVDYDPAATCPRWEQFLAEIFSGKLEIIDFVHRAIGYTFSGDTSEHCLFLCQGMGRNGKSTFLDTLADIAGDYYYNLPFSALELKSQSAIPNDIAALPGRRFVTASETNAGTPLNTARIKNLTGGDPMSARHLHQKWFSFKAVCKVWLAFNHKPAVKDDSFGFWERVHLIPFERSFTKEERDHQLKDKLHVEWPGILAWVVRGCQEWQKRGLGAPTDVLEETLDYQIENDPLAEFIEARCTLGSSSCVSSALLWKVYLRWAEEVEEKHHLSRNNFGMALKGRGIKQRHMGPEDARVRTWVGIGVRMDEPGTQVEQSDFLVN